MIGLGLGLGFQRAAVVEAAPAGTTYITIPDYATINVFGDSYTNPGAYASVTANSFPELLAVELGATLTNKGGSGTVLQNSNDASGSPRAGNGRDRFYTASTGAGGGIIGTNARAALFICLGFNDARYRGAPSTFNSTSYKNDLSEILNGCLGGSYAHEDVYLATPWYITDAGLATYGSDGNFAGQLRSVYEEYITKAREVAVEYGIQFTDMYAALNTSTFAASVASQDNIHPDDVGHAEIKAAFIARTERPNTITRPSISGAAPGANQLQVTLGAVAGAADYTMEYSVDGTFVFGDTFTGGAGVLTKTWTSVSPGTYRTRGRANFADGTHSPWVFSSTVNVSALGGLTEVITGETASYVGVANNTTLETTTPTSGTWTKVGTGTARIYGEHLKGSTSNSTTCLYRLTGNALGGTTIGVFAEAEINILTDTGAGLVTGITVRQLDNSNYLYAAYDESLIKLVKRVGATETVLGTYTTELTGSGNTLRLEVGSNSQYVYLDGVLVIAAAEPDANLTGLGTYQGVVLKTVSATNYTGTNGPVIDYFKAGRLE